MQNLRENRDLLLLGGGMITIIFICGCFTLIGLVLVMSNGDDKNVTNAQQPTPVILIATTQAPAITPTRLPSATPTTQSSSENNNGNTGPSASVVSGTLNLRTGPGVAYPIVQALSGGQTMKLTGRTSDNAWVQVQLSNNAIGWVSTSYIEANVTISSLPVASAPPLPPTTAPTATTAATPQISINPTIGYVGTPVTVSVTNFPANTQVEIHLGLGPNQYSSETLVSATTNGSGAVTMTFNMPAEWTRGAPITSAINILAATSNYSHSAIATFSWNPPLVRPTVFLSPEQGTVGTVVSVQLVGFPPNTDFGIHLGRSESNYDASAWVVGRTDLNGNVTTVITLPPNWQDGTPITTSDLYIVGATTDKKFVASRKLVYTYTVQTLE